MHWPSSVSITRLLGLESPKALSEKKRDIARLLTEQNARKNAN